MRICSEQDRNTLLHSTARQNDVCLKLYTKKGKPPHVKTLPPTDANLLLHILRAHHQTMLWKAADKDDDPVLNIADFGWEVLNNVPSPVIASRPPAPPELMKVISCQCRAVGKACSQANCSCLAAGLPCTIYCRCEGASDECHNPIIKKDENVAVNNHEDDTADDIIAGILDLSPNAFLDHHE